MAPRCAAWPARLNVSRLRVVHSPHDVCARWEPSLPAPVAHQPLWELAAECAPCAAEQLMKKAPNGNARGVRLHSP